MLRRIKNLWNLSQYKAETEFQHDITNDPVISTGRVVLKKDAPTVKAEFFSEGSEEDFRENEREAQGLKGLFGLK